VPVGGRGVDSAPFETLPAQLSEGGASEVPLPVTVGGSEDASFESPGLSGGGGVALPSPVVLVEPSFDSGGVVLPAPVVQFELSFETAGVLPVHVEGDGAVSRCHQKRPDP